MQKLYLVAYDITNKKRWRKAYRIVREYYNDGQYSCYECWLTAHERELLIKRLEKVLTSADSLTVANIDSCQNDHVYLGCAKPMSENEFLLVG